MYQGLDGGLVQVAQIAGSLARLLPKHHGLGTDKTEGINDDLHRSRTTALQ